MNAINHLVYLSESENDHRSEANNFGSNMRSDMLRAYI